MPSKDYLMLRSAQRAHLETRTALLQRSFRQADQFPDSLLRGNDDPRRACLVNQCTVPKPATGGVGEPRRRSLSIRRASSRRSALT